MLATISTIIGLLPSVIRIVERLFPRQPGGPARGDEKLAALTAFFGQSARGASWTKEQMDAVMTLVSAIVGVYNAFGWPGGISDGDAS